MTGMGTHVQYEVPVEVSLRSQESAVVHVASRPIRGERVLVFDKKENETVCQRAVHLTNTSEIPLAPGKVAIFEGGSIAGHAVFPPMLPQDDELIFFGLDDSLAVTSSVERSETTTGCRLLRNAKTEAVIGAELTKRIESSVTYVISNNDSNNAVPKFYLDHTASTACGGYTITTEEKCVKKTPSGAFARYAFSLEPLESVTFVVDEYAERLVGFRTVSAVRDFLTEETPALVEQKLAGDGFVKELEAMVLKTTLVDVLKKCCSAAQHKTNASYCSASDILQPAQWRAKMSLSSDWEPLLAACEKLLGLEAEGREIQQSLRANGDHTEAIHVSQKRIRENIKALEKLPGSKLMDRYMADLDREEDDLIETRKGTEKLKEQEASVKMKLKDAKAELGDHAETILVELRE